MHKIDIISGADFLYTDFLRRHTMWGDKGVKAITCVMKEAKRMHREEKQSKRATKWKENREQVPLVA